jgi:D-alanyl-D-alanine carboxypeptidase
MSDMTGASQIALDLGPYSPRVHPGRPSRRQILIRRLVAGVLAVVAVAVVVALVRAEDDGADGKTDAQVTATTTTSAASVLTTTTAPSVATVVADPLALTVLVNKHWRLPPGWEPPDLVEPDVPFTFSGDDPKRLLRQPAATALESLFAAAAQAGTPLAAVSGYRSEQTQADLYELSVSEQGAAQADLHSARPGHSEHQTGLAMDVTSADGSCAVEDCFGATPAATWLAAHAAEHGFIVRYPAGEEAITGYAYEPWHLRFVGGDAAQRLVAQGLVLEELPT